MTTQLQLISIIIIIIIIKNARSSASTLHATIVYYRAEGLCLLHLIRLPKIYLPDLHARAVSSETRQKTDTPFLTNAPRVDAITSRASSTCLAFFETSDVDSAHCYVFNPYRTNVENRVSS